MFIRATAQVRFGLLTKPEIVGVIAMGAGPDGGVPAMSSLASVMEDLQPVEPPIMLQEDFALSQRYACIRDLVSGRGYALRVEGLRCQDAWQDAAGKLWLRLQPSKWYQERPYCEDESLPDAREAACVAVAFEKWRAATAKYLVEV